MELAGAIWDFATRMWDCTASNAAYVMHLKETLASLKMGMEELKAIRDDVELRLKLAVELGKTPRKQVIAWLKRVEATENVVNEIFSRGEVENGTSEVARFPRCRSAYRLGKKATKTLTTVGELISKGEFQEVADQQSLSASVKMIKSFSELPMGKTVGVETTLEVVLDRVKDDAIGIIGLYGMGGVGKTTLLKRMYNELPGRDDGVGFDVAFWVVASKQATVKAIQQDILDQLPVASQLWTNKPFDVKAAIIFKFLKTKKYVLMLDDVWQRLDLSEVGLPMPENQNGCKIIFTTRSEETCGFMEAHWKFKVTCLSWEKAWFLFQEKVGEATLSSHCELPRLAAMVAKECHGLPLALVTIGRAMASRKTPYEWSHALQVLRNYPSQLSGMGDHVLPIMKFSYDSLPDPIIKACFLYCSIFPEDYEIPRNKLVNLWVGEGYLKEFGDISEARNHGYYIIESLKLACLLESGTSPLTVKMHDLIRYMALWIACACGKENNKFLVVNQTELIGAQSHTRDWPQEVQKISLWGNSIKELLLTSSCPELSTFVVNDTEIREISMGIFQLLPFVKLLDFSGNVSFTCLPKEIQMLTCLEYLDLSRTSIRTLPLQISSLAKLRYLLLNYMEKLRECPPEIIARLNNLRIFHMNCCAEYSEALLSAFEISKELSEISICLNSNSLKLFRNSKKLQRCVRYLRLDLHHARASPSFSQKSTTMKNQKKLNLSSTNMKNIEALQVYGSNSRSLGVEEAEVKVCTINKLVPPEACFWNLHHVVIYQCDQLVELNWLVYAPCLENLWVGYCSSIYKILDPHQEEFQSSSSLFSSLKILRLDHLPALAHIHNKPLTFHSLEKVYVYECPKLLELSFDGSSAKNSLVLIKGEADWWNRLQWTDSSLQEHLYQYFQIWRVNLLESICGPFHVGCAWPESSEYQNIFQYPTDEELKHVLRSSRGMWME